jgi:DNA-directed RNA polymerase specialized sigma24 family protein
LTASSTGAFGEDYEAKPADFDRALRLRFKGLLSDSDREELYQEACTELLAMIHKGGEVKTRPDALVYRIGERRAIDLLKKRDRVSARISRVEEADLGSVADPARGTDEQFEIREDWRLCRQVLATALNLRERRVFAMRVLANGGAAAPRR